MLGQQLITYGKFFSIYFKKLFNLLVVANQLKIIIDSMNFLCNFCRKCLCKSKILAEEILEKYIYIYKTITDKFIKKLYYPKN